MYIIKNAFKNLARNKKRYLLQGCIVFLLLIGICISIIVGDTLDEIIKDYGNRFQVNASLEVDYMSLLQKGKLNDYSCLTQQELEGISKSKYVKKMYSSMDVGVCLKHITAIGEEQKQDDNGLPQGITEENLYLDGEPKEIPNACIKGYDDVSQLSDFINGTRKLSEGRYYENVNECIISSELAQRNNLSVGSTLEFQGNKQKEPTSLKIVGIYLDAKPVDDMLASEPTANCRNDILVKCDTVKNNFEDGTYNAYAVYVMDSAEHIKDFENELKKQGILDTYKLNSNKADFDRMVKPVQKLGSIINVFQVIIVICGSIVLLVLSIISVQERTYEIGVLRSRGMKKSKLVIQFILENVIMVSICLIMGLTISMGVSEPLSNKMLNEQISLFEEQQNEQKKVNDNMSATAMFVDSELANSYGDNSNVSRLDTIKIQMSTIIICKIVVIAIGLALLASMTSVLTIMRYEPSKILANRN